MISSKVLSALSAAMLAQAVLCGSALADDSKSADTSSDPTIEFERYNLANGLEVILHKDNTVPLVAVNVWYHVGSGDEVVGKSGFAHLFEHMLFQGSQHVGEDRHFEVLKGIGASGVNGTTNTDRTNYFETVPSHQIETALWLESDRMGYLLPLLTKKSLDNQIEVVRNERRQNYDNRPYGSTLFAKAAALYPEGHPYRYLTIGRHEDLATASLEDVTNFYKKWYAPANATLVLAGDFETDTAKRLVEKWFGGFATTEKPTRTKVPAPELTETKRVEVSDNFAKLRQIEYVWHSPALYADGDAELDLLAHALGANGTGRLYKLLVRQKEWAQSVSVYQYSREASGEFAISVTLKSGADLKKVEKLIASELKKALRSPMSQKEFNRAVVSQENRFVWGLESLMSRAQTLQSYNHFLGKPDAITWDLDRWRKSDPKKVLAAAQQYLSKPRVEALTNPAAPESGEAKGGPGSHHKGGAHKGAKGPLGAEKVLNKGNGPMKSVKGAKGGSK